MRWKRRNEEELKAENGGKMRRDWEVIYNSDRGFSGRNKNKKVTLKEDSRKGRLKLAEENKKDDEEKKEGRNEEG